MLRLLSAVLFLVGCASEPVPAQTEADADTDADSDTDTDADTDADTDTDTDADTDTDTDSDTDADLPAPLAVHPDNGRWLVDSDGQTRVLVGVNHGWELQDNAWMETYATDWDGWLDTLASYNLNFVRLWRSEAWLQGADDPEPAWPMPYAHSDGVFDLDAFDPAYFERLRDRVDSAAERDIIVDVMLFERHSSYKANGSSEWPWKGHPYHPDRNVQGVDGDAASMYLLPEQGGSAQVLAVQEAYVREVIGAVVHADNVLFEVCNECPIEANDWQQHMLEVARERMAEHGRMHLVGFTGPGRAVDGTWPDFDVQLSSSADFVSPRDASAYRNNPPANDGSKVIFADSDHIDPYGRDEVWVWKSFLRGLHPQALEPFTPADSDAPARDERVRQQLGRVNQVSQLHDLAKLQPRNALCSTKYAMAHPGSGVYVALAPEGGSFELDASGAPGTMWLSWLDLRTDALTAGGEVEPGELTLTPPFAGPAVAHLSLK